MFLHTGLTELHVIDDLYRSTVFVISRLVFFLIGREFSEGVF